MGTQKETLNGLRETYERIRRLIDEDSLRDPETEPYASKYRARALLDGTVTVLRDPSNEDLPHRVPMLAAVLLDLGQIAVDTDETSDADRHLADCLSSLKDADCEPDTVVVAISALNQLGFLHSRRGDHSRAERHLRDADGLYLRFRERSADPPAIEDPFAQGDRVDSKYGALAFEKVHTLTLYYLAQVYASLEDYSKASIYCHVTLRRQLEMEDYDPIDWALNSATLSQFFMERNQYRKARHHLSAASYILDRYQDELSREDDRSEAHDAKMETFKHRSADVARCWVKYGLTLLTDSKERLLKNADEDDDVASDMADLKLSENDALEVTKESTFPTLDVSMYEGQIVCSHILAYEDARAVFLTTKSWLDRATEYYTIENLASDHIQIMQDASHLYRQLAFFEEDEDRQAKMEKRRIDILEKVIKDLNPTYYMTYLRQIWYELGKTYQELMTMKAEKLQGTERPTPHALNKINNYAQRSIKYFEDFLDSMASPTSKEPPKKFPADMEKPALTAYFQIGSVHMKLITMDKHSQVKNYEATLKAFTSFCEYCKVNEGADETLKTEHGICKEMIELLPYKIQKLKGEIPSN